MTSYVFRPIVFNSYSASHDNWCTAILWNRIMTAQCEGMGKVGSVRYEPALLPPCPSIRALSYSNCQRSTHSNTHGPGSLSVKQHSTLYGIADKPDWCIVADQCWAKPHHLGWPLPWTRYCVCICVSKCLIHCTLTFYQWNTRELLGVFSTLGNITRGANNSEIHLHTPTSRQCSKRCLLV